MKGEFLISHTEMSSLATLSSFPGSLTRKLSLPPSAGCLRSLLKCSGYLRRPSVWFFCLICSPLFLSFCVGLFEIILCRTVSFPRISNFHRLLSLIWGASSCSGVLAGLQLEERPFSCLSLPSAAFLGMSRCACSASPSSSDCPLESSSFDESLL